MPQGPPSCLLHTRWGVTAYRHSSHFYLIPSESLNPCVQPGMPSYKAYRLMALTVPGFSTQHAPDIHPPFIPAAFLLQSVQVRIGESSSVPCLRPPHPAGLWVFSEALKAGLSANHRYCPLLSHLNYRGDFLIAALLL